MPSIFLRYDNKTLKTTKLAGNLRSLSWDSTGRYVIVVGNKGRVLRIEGDEAVTLDSGTRLNLRGVSTNPSDGTALIVGNRGLILLLDGARHFTEIASPTTENLRSVSWNSGGTVALIAGNRGTLLKYVDRRIETIACGRANLRQSSWRPKSDQALVTSNCFAEEFIPSPNLFSLDLEKGTATALNEGRSDLIGVDWKPTGESALLVGYDVVWHNGFIGNFDGTKLSPVRFDNRRMYPVAISWKPVGEVAAIGTATAQLGMSMGELYLWDGKSLKAVYTSKEFFFGAVAWNSKGTDLAALASSATRTFNC